MLQGSFNRYFTNTVCCNEPLSVQLRHEYAAHTDREFLRDLTAEDRKQMGENIKTAQFGWPIGMPLIRKLDSGLWEVRSHINDGIARVLFTAAGDRMVLLHASVKKSQKTPANSTRNIAGMQAFYGIDDTTNCHTTTVTSRVSVTQGP